jgi:hypothetical protein
VVEIVGINSYKILVGKSEGEGTLGWPRRRCERSIKVDLKETRFEDVEWINLAQDSVVWWAVVNTVINLRVSYKARDFLCC